MTRITSIAIAFGLLAISVVPQSASAVSPWGARAGNIHSARHAQQQSWHGGYRYMNSGYPQALVVPPNANMQTNYSWGVGSSRMTPIHHQWGRPDPGATSGAGHLGITPHWPTSTTQFGVYYVRGPWTYHAAQAKHGHGNKSACNDCGRHGCKGRCGHHGSRSACGCNNCRSGKGSCTNCQSGTAAPADAPANAPPAPGKGEV